MFTYTFDFENVPRDRVRFEIGDTNAALPIYQDAELDAMLAVNDDEWQPAVIMALEGEVARLRRVVNFTADWLKVDTQAQLKAAETLLAKKKTEYGLNGAGTLNTGVGHVYRTDSLATEEPDYQD